MSGDLYQSAFGPAGRPFRLMEAQLSQSKETTSAELFRISNQLAQWLNSVSEPDAVIGIDVEPGLEYLALYWGILLSGRTTFELDPHLAERERQSRLEFVQPQLVLTGLPKTTHSPAISLAQPAPNPASLVFTSGTTGGFKAATLSRSNLSFVTHSIWESLGRPGKDEVYSTFLPFHHTYGKSVLLLAAMAGGTLILSDRAFTPTGIVDLIRRFGITHLSLVPLQARTLLRSPDFCQHSLRTVRRITVAGGALDRLSLRDLCSRFPGRIMPMYGLTEASTRVTCMPGDKLEQHFGSAGLPIPGVEIRIGENDEILVKGANVMLGYWKDDESTERTLHEGWLQTGDQGYLDEDGFLYVQGRLKDTIKTSGHSIPASRLEQLILELPGISEVAVVGAPDLELGEKIVAYLVGALPKDQSVRNYCRKMLGPQFVPHEIVRRGSLPRTKTGKVIKSELGQPEGPTQ